MSEINNAVMAICMIAAAAGLFSMLVPSGKFKSQLSFIISCIIAVCFVGVITNAVPSLDYTFSSRDYPIVDFDESLTESAGRVSANAVRDKVKQFLSKKGYFADEIYVITHIGEDRCISIIEIELVFDKSVSDTDIANAVNLLQSEVGNSITVKYSVSRV